MPKPIPFVSIVLPVYKNCETLSELHRQISTICQQNQIDYEILFIIDASPDASLAIVQNLSREDPRVRYYSFEKNVGQHHAVLKGIKLSEGEIIISMDADLQDPPAMIPRLLRKLEEGYEAVFAGRRGKYESAMRLFTSKIFKYFLHHFCKVPKDAGMFFAITRRMAKALQTIPMRRPFVVAMIGLTELKHCSLPCARSRNYLGKTAYTSRKRLSIGISTLIDILILKKFHGFSQTQKTYYAKADHPSIFPENHPTFIDKLLGKTFEYLPTCSEEKMIEVGCGMGRFTLPIAQKQKNIQGLDISPALLEALQKRMPSIPVHCADILLPPKNLEKQFDIALGYFVLHHLPDPKKAFASISSLLKPRGKIFFIEPNPFNLLYYLQILFHPKMRWKNERYMLKMRKKTILEALTDFSEIKVERFGFFPPFLHKKWGKWEQKLEKISFWNLFLPYQVFYAEKNSKTH